MKEKLRHIGRLYVFIFIFWGLYRLVFRLPQDFEEIILKPLLWLGPTFYLVYVIEKRKFSSLGYDVKNFKNGIIKGLAFGAMFFLVGVFVNYIKDGSSLLDNFPAKEILLPSFFLAFITAVSEETVFRGYIMNRLKEILGKGLPANIISSIGFALIHLPISIFVYHYNVEQLIAYLVLIILTSLGSGLLFDWTGSVWASILIHLFWGWPIAFLNK